MIMLVFIAGVLFIMGGTLVIRSFRSSSKGMLIGAMGVFLLLCSGNIIIYLYSSQPTSKRLQEWNKQELPDLGMEFKDQKLLDAVEEY